VFIIEAAAAAERFLAIRWDV